MKAIHAPSLKLVWSTPDPRRVVAIAARMTYSAMDVDRLADNLTDEEITKSVNAILERRHWSVLRHISFCFTISGVSRALSHQLVRHTVGHSFEQRSQHYRTEKDPSFVEPKSIVDKGHKAFSEYHLAMSDAQLAYERLMEIGVPKDDARSVLPNAIETQLIWTCNAEALLNFIKTRACRVNTPEIMHLAIQARKLVLPLFPELGPFMGPPCLGGMCYEGPKFYTHCAKPWKSPTVLWTPDFPAKIKLVGIGGDLAEVQVVDVLNTLKEVDDEHNI